MATLPIPGLSAIGAKMTMFRALEWASEVREGLRDSPGASQGPQLPTSDLAPGALWVFASTIGELNAIEPFMKLLLDEVRPDALVLLTDRDTYRDSYLAQYPRATVCELGGTSRELVDLVRAAPPRFVLLAEIPCMLFDAPCRLPFGAIYELKRRGIPICLINGWLYGNGPSSKLDRIEKALFGGDYLRLLDLITVQTDDVRKALIRHGADPARVIVTGNIKFDAVKPAAWSPLGKRSEHLLRGIVEGARPCIVAGCITDRADQQNILEAFKPVSARIPNALLVLAPRHPEQRDRMAQLERYCADAGYDFAFRSRLSDRALPETLQVLVLDTIGELKDFYAAATVAHVGRNHNLLEPLVYGKPVTTSGLWEPQHPSYPVHRVLVEAGAIVEQDRPDRLAAEWLRMFSERAARAGVTQSAREVLAHLAGASARNLELLRRHLGVFGRFAR